MKKLVLTRDTIRKISGGAFVVDDGGGDPEGGGCPAWTGQCGTDCGAFPNGCSPMSGECTNYYTCPTITAITPEYR